MRVFDFDGTLYAGDSTIDFYLFCLRQKKSLLAAVPMQLALMLKAILLGRERTQVKEGFYHFLNRLDDIDDAIETFWASYSKKLNNAVIVRAQPNDYVISASPDFLLRPLCSEYGLKLIASPVDKYTGRCFGENCRGLEKVRRLYCEDPGAVIEEFYTDSLTDSPLASLALTSFLVTGKRVEPFPVDEIISEEPSSPA